MAALEANQTFLEELEAMGFTSAQAARALQFSGNTSIEAAINWIIEHDNESGDDQASPKSIGPDNDQGSPVELPQMTVDIDLVSPKPFHITEKMGMKAQELRDQAHKKKQEEEKLKREKEKERIRVGKELLESKRIAEENEQTRNIYSRKAEKEEVKRAKEKIHRIEEDKMERRRKESSVPIVPEKKNNYWSVNSAKKAELLRECLRSLKRNIKDDDARVKRAFQTLLIYVGNVGRNPNEEKFRKIRLGNPLFQERVGSLKGGVEFLELCGFERIADNKYLYLPGDQVDISLLNIAGSELKSAMSNPFFGLISRVF